LKEAREQYEKQRQSDRCTLTQEQKAQILALAEDFPRLWKDPATSDRDRKRTARLILEDVTLTREGTLITAQVRFKGGATRVLSVTAPPAAPQMRKTKTHIIAEIDRLLEECTNSQIAAELNKKGWRSSDNRPFSALIIQQLICNHKLPDRAERLCAKGLQAQGKSPNLSTANQTSWIIGASEACSMESPSTTKTSIFMNVPPRSSSNTSSDAPA
jgi:hypothetical protein